MTWLTKPLKTKVHLDLELSDISKTIDVTNNLNDRTSLSTIFSHNGRSVSKPSHKKLMQIDFFKEYLVTENLDGSQHFYSASSW